ncbi:MAG: sulfide/dihydroorotate dehydrogenase-like FAD/NAD-binding protein [Phycisphaerae bacterium]|nr:sulfide/dihydroorotate dehydrogenase-like FAD/NAD-binding protein [Phycisphaerae bacterium]
MYKLVDKRNLGPNLTLYEVQAPRIASSRKPGQFVIVRAFDHSERIPLTIADVNKDTGTVTIIVQTVGKSTAEMETLEVGGGFCDVAGPLGQPSHLDNFGTVVVIGGGLGTAVVYPQAVALKELGNKVISIIGARSSDLVIMKDQLGAVSDKVMVTTNDGSEGIKGFVTDALQQLIDNPDMNIGAVYCVGPVVMMKAVADLTAKYDIHTVVSLNPVMVDGTGMCGGCRVTVGGETKFACVDGPEFDGHKVDFDELADRLTTYQSHERHKDQCRMLKAADKIKE